VLFTVVSRDEKYSAKLVIDTVVQRLGDALAAAAFQVLGEWSAAMRSATLHHMFGSCNAVCSIPSHDSTKVLRQLQSLHSLHSLH
jgi:ATP/ADP translocase